jgi:hypothetical protein
LDFLHMYLPAFQAIYSIAKTSSTEALFKL